MGINISEDVKEIKMHYSEIEDTTEYKKRRVQYIKDWPNNEQFEIEKRLFEKINELPNNITFIPFEFNYLEENTYNLLLSLFLDALDFLPNRPDLSFDFIWRIIDTYSSEVFPGLHGKDTINKCIKQIWTPAIENNAILKEAIDSLFLNIPVQSCKYLFKRLYENFDEQEDLVKQSHKDTRQLIGRLVGFNGGKIENDKIARILVEINDKYGYTPHTPAEIRKGSMLFYRLFDWNDNLDEISFGKREYETELDIKLKTEHQIEIDLKSKRGYKIDLEDKLNILINGILYTFRNDRAHGAVFSPFRSSMASLKTYAHSNFCFLAAYILLLILMSNNNEYKMKNESVVENITQNIYLFQKLYGRELKA
ncbi:hypothetical protein [Pseudalkalibacillus sp. JSM 102089]|uniref:hypothetical protein n=1 Tax=Pseudalkalibacillus sp. JSM 102089 TaxID=3229856 RepID=UPI0035233060